MKVANTDNGSACLELMLVAPMVAAFIILIVQFHNAFRHALRNIAEADATASELIREHERENWSSGFIRPCLEMIEPSSVIVEGEPVRIKFARYGREFTFPQEVKIAVEDICDD